MKITDWVSSSRKKNNFGKKLWKDCCDYPHFIAKVCNMFEVSYDSVGAHASSSTVEPVQIGPKVG
jgi:hypothetical protein